MARKQKRRVTRHRARNRRTPKRSRRQNSPRNQEARVRRLAVINGVRRGKYKTVSAGARAEGTAVASTKRSFPAAFLPSKRGERLRVRASDRYSASVEILTDSGAVVVTAYGSRERELAGQHRAAYLRVLRGDESDSILRTFRRKTVGGHRLLTNPERLFELAHGGVVDNLAPLYVNPEASV